MCIITLVLVFIAGAVLAASRQPREFRLARSAVFSAAPDKVFEHVNNLEKWQAWSPWVRMEPTAKSVMEGPKAGVGAKVSWEGKKTGTGTMTIVESNPGLFLRFRLDFKKPMQATQYAEFLFLPVDGKTRVTWTMIGENKLISKIVGLIMNCDKMIGGQFDSGLQNLKEIVET